MNLRTFLDLGRFHNSLCLLGSLLLGHSGGGGFALGVRVVKCGEKVGLWMM